MTTPQQIRDWLQKIEYPDPNPSDEALQTLCRGAMGPIFQQMIDRVKSKLEVEHTKKVIIVNKLLKDPHLKFSSPIMDPDHTNIEQLKLYHEKRKLEKHLQEIDAQNIENEASLEHLKAKIKSKNAKYQTIKEKMRKSEKDIVLFKAKSENLQKQLETCQKLHTQSKMLERTEQVDIDTIAKKITESLSKLHDLVSSFNHQLPPKPPDLATVSENSIVGPLQTSCILSSNKKPLSSIKKAKRANSTRKNLGEITNNYSLMSSTLRKKNLSKISFISSNIVSHTNSFTEDQHFQALKELEQICWNDQTLRKLTDELWQSNCDKVFACLLELTEKHKDKIAGMIAQNDSRNKNYDEKSVSGIEKLYVFHVETEMKRIICQQEQNKIQKMLDNINFAEDIQDITVLKATEFSLENAIETARNHLIKLQHDMPDNSDKLNQILNEIKNVQTEIVSTKCKIQTLLCIFRECSSWMENHQKNIFESIKNPEMYSEYDLLKSNIAEQDVDNFVSCSFQSQISHYFNSWPKIYSNPELLEIIQCPYLSPENTINFFFDQKHWLRQLQMLQKTTVDDKLNKKLSVVNIAYDENQTSNSYKKSTEQLIAATFACSDILKRLSEVDTELKYFMELPLNDCVAPNIKFENKTLKEYCEMYDSYFKLLK